MKSHFPRLINQSISLEVKVSNNCTLSLSRRRIIQFFANGDITIVRGNFSTDASHQIPLIPYTLLYTKNNLRESDPLLLSLFIQVSRIGRDFKDFAEQSNGLRMGVFRPRRRVGPSAEAESRVGVATDANYPHQIPTIHLNSVPCQKNRRRSVSRKDDSSNEQI